MHMRAKTNMGILDLTHCLMTSMFQIRSLGWLYYYFVTYASRIVTYSLRKVRPQGHRTPLNFRPSRTEWIRSADEPE